MSGRVLVLYVARAQNGFRAVDSENPKFLLMERQL